MDGAQRVRRGERRVGRGPGLATKILTPLQQSGVAQSARSPTRRARREDKVFGAGTTLLNSVRPGKRISLGKSAGGA
jgi:hypothetical protein